MDIKKLQTLVIDALEDVKAQNIQIFDTAHLTSMFDRIAIASGTSNRQTRALASSVRDKVKENGGDIVSIEGEDTGEWVLVDLGDMVVHIMQQPIRDYYRLEEIWGEKEVKFGAAKRTSKRTAEEDAGDGEAPKKRGRHLVASQAAEEEPKPARRSARSAEDADSAEKKPARKRAATTKSATAAPTGRKVKVAAPRSTSAAPKKAAGTARKTAAKRAPGRTKSAD